MLNSTIPSGDLSRSRSPGVLPEGTELMEQKQLPGPGRYGLAR